jgi:hypothetical protein
MDPLVGGARLRGRVAGRLGDTGVEPGESGDGDGRGEQAPAAPLGPRVASRGHGDNVDPSVEGTLRSSLEAAESRGRTLSLPLASWRIIDLMSHTATYALSLQRTALGWALTDAQDRVVFEARWWNARRRCLAHARSLGVLRLTFDEQRRAA